MTDLNQTGTVQGSPGNVLNPQDYEGSAIGAN